MSDILEVAVQIYYIMNVSLHMKINYIQFMAFE